VGACAAWRDVRADRAGKNADNPAAIAPAGTVHCRLEDWAKFIAAHLAGARGTGALLKAETYTKLHTPLTGQDYALGWGVTQRSWAGACSPTPAATRCGMRWCGSRREELRVLVATNAGGKLAEKATDEAAWALIQQLNP